MNSRTFHTNHLADTASLQDEATKGITPPSRKHRASTCICVFPPFYPMLRMQLKSCRARANLMPPSCLGLSQTVHAKTTLCPPRRLLHSSFIRQPSISIIFTAITFSISLRSSISPKKWLTVKIHKQFTPIPTSSTRDS